MPLSRSQPSPERQTALSFVSPSVADLLFYETVDAKTVGAGSGVTISSATWAAASISVPAGTHKAGFTVTVNTSAAHQFLTGDVVTVEGLGDREDDAAYSRPNGPHKITKVDADTFTYFVSAQPDAASPLDVTNNPHCYKAHPSYGTAHPDTENFPRHKLCYVKQADGEGLYFEYYYAADRRHQDDYNFEFSQADLGGNQYDTVVRTYVILRSDFTDTDTEYAAGDAMPDVPASQFNDDYILMTRQQKRIGDSELDSLFVVEQRVYFKDENKFSFNTHPEFKEELKTTEILAYVGKEEVPVKNGTVTWDTVQANAAVNWGIDINNSYNYEVQKVSNDWWKVIKQQIVGSNRLTAPTGKLLARRPYAMAKEEIHTHVTPVVGDVLFYVTVERPANASDGTPAHPAYGTVYGIAPFASHKLCFVKQADPEGQYFQYYYAADRANQDNYNFEFSQADLGGNQYDTVVRTYVILRSAFDDTDSSLEAGDAMPDAAGLFNDEYILMTRQQKRIGEKELDSLYVIEQRVYFKDEDKFSFNTHPEFKEELKTTEIVAHVGKIGVPVKNGTVTWSAEQAAAAVNWGIDITNSYNYEVQKVSNDWWKIVKQQIVGSNRLPPAGGASKMLDRRPYAVAKEETHAHVTPVVGDVLFYVTVDRPANASDGTPDHPAYGTAYGTAPFADHKLCFVKQVDPEGQFFQYYYAAERANQDNYNFEFSQADLGGNKYDTVVRTYVILRSDFADNTGTLEAGDAMDDPTGQFAAENVITYDRSGSPDAADVSTDYILMTRQQKRIGEQELDSLFVVEQRVYFRRVDIVSQSLDPATEGTLKTVVKLIRRGETFASLTGTPAAGATTWEYETNWGLSTDGQNIESSQLSHDWWQVTIQDVIPQGLGSEYGGKVLREYDTWQNFTWPSVVDGLVFTSAARKDGASQTAVTVRMKQGKQGFSGPTKMTVKQVWSKTKFTGSNFPDPTVFKPTSARYSGVQYSVSVSNVLTPAITLIDFIGTEHPTYKMGEYAFPKPWCLASDPTDWPASAFVGATTQKPFRGGYLMEVVTVHPPS